MCKKWLCVSLGAALVLSMGLVGCSDDDNGPDVDAGMDAGDLPDSGMDDADVEMDGGDVDADIDAGGEPGCTGESPAEPQDVGGCCNNEGDCNQGYCFGGYCTAQCSDDTDCEPTSVGPFPLDTEFTCNTNEMGFFNFCAPGSLQLCGGDGDSPCPAGESCVLGWDHTVEIPNDPGQPGLRGVCVTNMAGDNLLAAGEQCDGHAELFFYQCEAPGYIMSACMGRRCTVACDVSNPTDTCPAGMECVGPLALDIDSTTPLLGTGLCAGQSCGSMEFTDTPDEDVRIPGVDSECPTGEVCTPYLITGESGEVFTMRCIPEVPAYGAPGDVCEQSEKFEQYCNHDLCLQQAAEWDSQGAYCGRDEDCNMDEVCVEPSSSFGSARCSPKPDPGFCTMMCRNDSDCPDINGSPSYCVNVGAGELPNGQDAYFTVCYPEDELFEETPITCEVESDCDATVGEGCLRLSPYSELKFCAEVVTPDPAGTDCTADPGVCGAGEACIEDPDSGVSTCTAVSAIGDACDPDDNICLSGYCFDGEFDIEDSNGDPTRTFCSGTCRTTDDCGVDQVCENILWAENDPAVDTDDISGGLCRPMVLPVQADVCANAGDCGGSKQCDTATGRCYTPGAAWGGPCADDSDCEQNGLCDDEVPNGLCYKPGCDPAAPGAYCGTGDVVCSDNNDVGVCLEACGVDGDCTRNGTDGHVCVNGACESP